MKSFDEKPEMFLEISLQQSSKLSMEEGSYVNRSFSPSRVSLRYTILSTFRGVFSERDRVSETHFYLGYLFSLAE